MVRPIRQVLRVIVISVLESLILYFLLTFVPGVTIRSWETAWVAIVVIALLNALVRPVILLTSARLGVIPFLLVALVLNAALVSLASRIVPGFDVADLWTAFLVAAGLAAGNAILTSTLSIDDDDSFYRNVIRRLARRYQAQMTDGPGTIIVQIDGLAEPILRRALAEGRMPTLASWIASGSHRLVRWECDIPSMTTSSQAGILHGNNDGLPAFYWYEKREARLMVSGRPGDLHDVHPRISDGNGLLADGGMSVTNLFGGDAARSIMTVSALLGDRGELRAAPNDFIAYLMDPYNLYRGLVGTVAEAIVEAWQGIRQRLLKLEPWTPSRFPGFVLMRGASCVLVRDATTWAVVGGMYRGIRIAYCDLLGYDEVAHYAGPETPDAVASLYGIDRQIAHLERAAREAPRPYQFVVLADHGQTTGVLFERAFGQSLEGLVRDLLKTDSTVHLSGSDGEGQAHLTAFLNELTAGSGFASRHARQMLGTQTDDDAVELPSSRRQRRRAERAEIVVTSSGNLGHIYFARLPDRLSLEQIQTLRPGLVEALVDHPGIDFVLMLSETQGPLVFGKHGIRALDPDHVVHGDDPLAKFSPSTGLFLNRLARYSNAGDIIVNGTYNPSTGQVITLDDLVGAHGGVGGMQTQPFLLFPADWTDEPVDLVGTREVHQFLRRYCGASASSTTVQSAS